MTTHVCPRCNDRVPAPLGRAHWRYIADDTVAMCGDRSLIHDFRVPVSLDEGDDA